MAIFRSLNQCLRILAKRDQRKYVYVVFIQVILGFLDLVSIAIIGVIGLITIKGVQSQSLTGIPLEIVTILNLTSFSFQSQVAVLGTFASITLILRTFLSMFLTWKVSSFLANRSKDISDQLMSRLINRGVMDFQHRNLSEMQHILGPGVFAISTGVLGTASTVLADLSSVVMISLAVILIDPLIGSVSILLFTIVGVFLHFGLRNKVEAYGKQFTDNSIKNSKLILELISGYRQIYLANRAGFYLDEMSRTRSKIANLYAVNSFLPGLGKYVIEIAIILGGLGIAATLFTFSDSPRAFAGLGVFIASGARIAPALLRIQQGILTIKSNLSVSYLTIDLIKDLENELTHPSSLSPTDFEHKDFFPRVEVSGVKFSYKNDDRFNIELPELTLEQGKFYAFVGASGSGKTTLIDIVLGILQPKSGRILVSGVSPKEAISKWPGAIAYIPQDIFIKEGTIKENIALGYTAKNISSKNVSNAIKVAQLSEYVESLPLGVDTWINERGTNLSGGQRQRLGIARAMYSMPKLLILDEATSSLDGIAEENLTLAIAESLSNVTRIVIAHRLSTVQYADRVFYIEHGRILASGSFTEVRSAVPDFDKTAGLMGL